VESKILRVMTIGNELEVLALPIGIEILTAANAWWRVCNAGGVIGNAAEGSSVNQRIIWRKLVRLIKFFS